MIVQRPRCQQDLECCEFGSEQNVVHILSEMQAQRALVSHFFGTLLRGLGAASKSKARVCRWMITLLSNIDNAEAFGFSL